MKLRTSLLMLAVTPMLLAGCADNGPKNVGLLYCSSEANSLYQVNVVKAELEKAGLTTKLLSFSDSNDLPTVLNGSIDKIDAIYIPTDNACASNAQTINAIARPKQKPVFAGEEGICKVTGTITLSISYYNIGLKTGEMAADVLLGKKDIKEMAIAYDEHPVKKYNKSYCEAIGLAAPEGFIELDADGGAGEAPTYQNINPNNKKFVIGISQFVTHDALDAATRGFQDAVRMLLGETNVTFDLQNAAAQIDLCSTIANSFVSHNVDLIMANATPALQACANATKSIPILGTSVTEYGVALGIDNFSGVTGTNVSGTSDLAPLTEQAKMTIEVFKDFYKK